MVSSRVVNCSTEPILDGIVPQPVIAGRAFLTPVTYTYVMQMCYIQTLGLNLDVFGKDYMQFQTAFPSYLGRQSMTKKYVNTMSSISRIV